MQFAVFLITVHHFSSTIRHNRFQLVKIEIEWHKKSVCVRNATVAIPRFYEPHTTHAKSHLTAWYWPWTKTATMSKRIFSPIVRHSPTSFDSMSQSPYWILSNWRSAMSHNNNNTNGSWVPEFGCFIFVSGNERTNTQFTELSYEITQHTRAPYDYHVHCIYWHIPTCIHICVAPPLCYSKKQPLLMQILWYLFANSVEFSAIIATFRCSSVTYRFIQSFFCHR